MINFAFGIIPIMSFLIFAMVICIFIFTFAKGIKTWNKNNNSPRLTVKATAVTKRNDVSRHSHHHGHHSHTSYSNTYYVTFQFDSGDRLELHVPSTEFGLIVEGDVGMLSFQGTRFLSFERI